MRTLRSAASVACLLCIGGQALAEDAREFWQGEWRRQPQQSHEASLDRFGGDRAGWGPQERRSSFGGEAFGYPYAAPRMERAQPRSGARAPRGRMPAVRVSNPEFYTYTPDKLANVALGAVCEVKTATSREAPRTPAPPAAAARR